MEEEIYISEESEESVLHSYDIPSRIGDDFPEDLVFAIALFLPYKYDDVDPPNDYPLHNFRLVSKTWDRACKRDPFWRIRFEKLQDYVVEEFDISAVPHRSIYVPRPISHRFLIQKYFKNDKTELDNLFDKANKNSQGHEFYFMFLRLMERMQNSRTRQKHLELIRVKRDHLFRFFFEQRDIFYQVFCIILFVLSTVAIQSLHSFSNNNFYLTDASYYSYFTIFTMLWTILLIFVFLVLFEIYLAYHVCSAKKVIVVWKYNDHPVFLARTLKQMDKNMRCKIAGFLIILIILFFHSTALIFMQVNLLWSGKYRFSIFLPYYLTCFAVGCAPVIAALLNGGMLSDGFPAVAKVRRIIGGLLNVTSSSGFLTFVMLMYYSKEALFFNNFFFVPLLVGEGFIILQIIWKIFEHFYYKDNANHRNFNADGKKIVDFYTIQGSCRKFVLMTLSLICALSFMASHGSHIYYNYRYASEEGVYFALHLLFYNFSVFLLLLILFLYVRWGIKNEFTKMEYETRYHSDFDSEYAM